MSSRVGEIHLGPRVVQPQSFPGRGQLVSLEETLEQQVTPLPQVRQATVGHPHPRTLAALAVRPHLHFAWPDIWCSRRAPAGRLSHAIWSGPFAGSAMTTTSGPSQFTMSDTRLLRC